MITDKTKDKLAKLSAKPIMRQLRLTAYEQVVEKFCMQRCGHTPDGELCDEAERTHRQFIAILFQIYSRLN